MSENTDQNQSRTRLYAKLAEVIGEVGYLSKEGRNQFQNYDYTTAEQILGAIRKPLSDRKVVLMPSLTSVGEREYETSKGKASVITTVRVTFTLIDSEDGGTHACEWAGQGDDPGDKGLGKAYTNAIKTFLREQFLIPQGDDPEADPKTDERTAQRQSSRPRPSQPQAAPKERRRDVLDDDAKAAIDAAVEGLPIGVVANAMLEASGGLRRSWDSDEEAQDWKNRAIGRFPAARHSALLNILKREKAAFASNEEQPEPTIPFDMNEES